MKITIVLIIGLCFLPGCNNIKDITGVEIYKLIKKDEETRANGHEKEENSTEDEYESENDFHISGGRTETDKTFHISGNKS